MQTKPVKPLQVRPDGMKVFGFNEKGQQICNRLRQASNTRCQSIAVCYPNGRCKKHGGTRVSGPLHPCYVHGKSSKYGQVLPRRYADTFAALREMGDWLSLKEDIWMTNARIKELFSRIEDLPSQITMTELSNLALRARRILDLTTSQNQRAQQLTHFAEDFIQALLAGDREREVWSEIRDTQKHLASLTTTEVRRKEVEELSIPAYDAYILFQSLISSIKNRVKDPHVVHLIAVDIRGLTAAIKLPNVNAFDLHSEYPTAPPRTVEYDFEDPPSDPDDCVEASWDEIQFMFDQTNHEVMNTEPAIIEAEFEESPSYLPVPLRPGQHVPSHHAPSNLRRPQIKRSPDPQES